MDSCEREREKWIGERGGGREKERESEQIREIDRCSEAVYI